MGLAGWVRNCSDGSVEVQAEGNEQRLTELRVWCESGPRAHGWIPLMTASPALEPTV